MKFSKTIIALVLILAEAVGQSLSMTTTTESTSPDPKATEVFLEEFQAAFDAMTADPPPPLIDFGAAYVALSHP